ncbi:MAG: N-acetylmuramoyl-L-alanine amidase [Bacteroidota bacterium]|nr:N-acetylmuramoyl-L-alanine amidase [Bacteroidota bacterium]MDP3146231.1 N-acetylmuramoyl-L-alanine amidase [Bacteroidota bacterium]MDP3558142.1 N-acetylmuramoyl-L-alanine amidase [Bacteroidota bacterium]
MKQLLTFLFSFALLISSANELLIENPYSKAFKKAYSLNPSIPKGILEAVSFTQTRFQHIDNSTEPSCIGYPKTYGVMGLVLDGKNYFRNNLSRVSQLSGFSEEKIIASPETSILAYAKAFSVLQTEKNIFAEDISKYQSILIELSELPVVNEIQNNFALNAHLYQLFWFLSKSEFQDAYSFPNHKINLAEIFGDNYSILSSKSITINNSSVKNQNGDVYKLTSNASVMSPDYPPALYNPAASCNYSSRNGTQISAVTIHFVQGSYAGCISWFQNCSASASAHYVIRSSDGQVTQMVLESAKAWHVGSENPYTVGIEHEGYINNASWFTNAMYNSSAALTKDICVSNNINPLRTYYGPGCSGTTAQCLQGSCVKVKGHQMNPNQSHTDPGPLWNWAKFYKLINNTYSITATYTTSSGAFYDSGGAAANYGSDERKFWLFTKPATTNITLSFTSFALEAGYDNLFIYNGGSINSPLIGQYTGTVNPGPVTSVNDSILVEFRSDCATTAAGWAANFIMNGTVTAGPIDNVAPTTVVNSANAWKTAAFTATISDVDNIGGSGVEKGYYQVIDFDGTEWRANYTKGFLADNFDNAIHPEWTQTVGVWGIAGNALQQTDEASPAAGNTNIYTSLTQSLSNRYMYHFLAKFEGAGTTRRAGLHFACDNPTLPNRNNSYFVWFRLDDQKVEIYKTINDVIGAPKISQTHTFSAGQWYDIKVIFDRITGKISVYWNNNIIATWTDTAPYQNGNSVSFRSGNCKYSIDEIKVYRSRAANVNVNVGSGLANDMRYLNPSPTQNAGKIKSICQDSAGNLSSIYFHDVNVDWTPPSNIAFVNDGPAADITTVNTTDSLRANWGTSVDPNSSIYRYWYSIGTSPGATNTQTWTSNWAATSVIAHTLSLTQNTIYYFNIMAENGAGLFSPVISSNGQKVDTTTINIGIKENSDLISLEVFPNPFSNQINFKLVNLHNSKIKIALIDITGREIKVIELKEEAGEIQQKISFSGLNLASGTYFIKVEIEGKLFYKKLLKE